MVRLDIATKANPARVLPALLLADYLEHLSALPNVTKVFQERAAPAGKNSIQLTDDNGKTLANQAVVNYLAGLARDNTKLQRASNVCLFNMFMCDSKPIPRLTSRRLKNGSQEVRASPARTCRHCERRCMN